MAKFEYEWQGTDRVRKRGEIEAPDREAAFAALRAQGIRAIRVEPKGWARGKGYKGVPMWAVVAIALGAALAAAVAVWTGSRGQVEERAVKPRRIANAAPRRYLPDVWPLLSKTNFFTHASENMLARFAMPGTDPGSRLRDTEAIIADFYDALDSDIELFPDDPPGVAALKRIVAGMKDEADIYLRTGMGIADYLAVLRQRQKMEMEYRRTILRENTPEEAAKILSALGMKP